LIALSYRWEDVEGRVEVEVGVNDDPAALGCEEFARGFPWMRAKVAPPARGYREVLGWVQLVDWTILEGGFLIDPFMPLGPTTQPFGFFGFAPTMFDAPHTDVEGDMRFVGHSFLCGLGGRLLELRHEVRALLGFSWGFERCDGSFAYSGPEVLGPADWDRHREYLHAAHPEWTFPPGFHEGRLEG
jgi:hypothetical protein